MQLFGLDINVFQALCAFATAIILFISGIYIGLQAHILHKQTKHLNSSLRNQTYNAIYDRMTQIDQFFTINHELKAYVYGAKKFPDDPIMHDQIMSACEMLADLFQQLVQLHKHGKLDPDNWLGWNRYMLSIYNSSDSFRHYLDVNGWWYTLDFVALFSAFPEDARDPGKVLIDRPTGGKLIGDTVLWAIYEEAFPADEKDPRDVIYATISKRKGAIIRAQCKDAHYNYKRTVGFAIVQPLLKPNLIRRLRVKFLIYLAVNRMVRGHGVGTQLLTEVTKWKVASSTVAEVDDPRYAESSADREIRERRLVFWERMGFRILKQDYWQPPLASDKKPVPMLLMVHGPLSIPAEEVIKGIYFEKYGAMNQISTDVLNQLYARMFPS